MRALSSKIGEFTCATAQFTHSQLTCITNHYFRHYMFSINATLLLGLFPNLMFIPCRSPRRRAQREAWFWGGGVRCDDKDRIGHLPSLLKKPRCFECRTLVSNAFPTPEVSACKLARKLDDVRIEGYAMIFHDSLTPETLVLLACVR